MKALIGLLAAALFAVPAFAWNCSNPLASRVDVGTVKPAGTAGDADGQWYKGSDASNPNDYYVCEVPKITPPTTPTPSPTPTQTPSTQSQNQSQSQSSANTNSNTNSSKSSSTSSSTSNATGGTASASNNSSGNQTSIETNVQAPKIPVDTAYAPTVLPTVTCFKGFSAGAQTMAFGGSFGGGKIDENCAILETARSFDAVGERIAACKVKISNKYAKAAGVSMEDCLQASLPAPLPPPPAPPQDRVIVVPAPPVPVAPPVIEKSTVIIGTSKYTQWNGVLRLLDAAILRLQSDTNATIVLTGPSYAGKAVIYLKARGIDPSRVSLKFADIDTVTVEVYSVK